MADFQDAQGVKWNVDLDGLLLGDLRDKGIDIVQDGLYALEEREDVLTKALVVLCREQREQMKITERDFARRIGAEVHEKAFLAVRGAAERFFRQSKWSEILSRWESRKKSEEMYRMMRPVIDVVGRPDTPEHVREMFLAAMREKLDEASTDSQPSGQDPNQSASGQGATPSTFAGSTPDSSAAETSKA